MCIRDREITVLQAGKAPGGAGSGDGVETSGSGANGDTESDLQGDVEQPDPNEADNEAGQDTEPETVPQDQPMQPDYSEADVYKRQGHAARHAAHSRAGRRGRGTARFLRRKRYMEIRCRNPNADHQRHRSDDLSLIHI